MLLSCIGVSVYATSYFLFTPRDDHFSRYILPLRLHIAGGMGALLAGPWQFSEKLRARALNFHRWLGRFYLSEVALGSIAGFALTLAAVTLRNYMPLMLFVLHCPFRTTYITVSWLCWVPNLLIAEWLIRRQRLVLNEK